MPKPKPVRKINRKRITKPKVVLPTKHPKARAASARAAPKKKKSNWLSTAGSAVGGFFGGPLGATIGGTAGHLLGSIFGMGAYKLRKNNLMMSSNGPAAFNANADGSCLVSHREYLQDVSGSTNFGVDVTLDLNPGLPTVFPWLSGIAANFQEYEFMGLVFEFKSTSGVAVSSTNTALGTVIMSTNYDPTAPAFATKQQMEAYQFTTAGSPSTSFYHPVECDPAQNIVKNLFIRTGNIPAGNDQRLYDLGAFNLATSGMQAVNTIGELWVTYQVRLLKPKLPEVTSGSYTHVVESVAGTSSATNPLGSAGGLVKSGTLGITVLGTPSLPKLLIPNQGTYIAFLTYYTTTGAFASAPTLTLGSNMSTVNLFSDDTAHALACNTTGAANTSIASYYSFTVNTPGTTIANQCPLASSSSYSAGYADIWIFALPILLLF